MSYADYTPSGPWSDGQSVTRNIDGVLFSYSAAWNALSIVPNTAGIAKNANGFLVTNLPTPVNPGDAANKAYVDAHSGGGGGGIPDAPSDGTTYGRNNAAWVNAVARAGDTMTGLLILSAAPTATLGAATKGYVDALSIPTPSSAIPGMDGTGSAGVAVTYSRGDHVHPTDTSRAPLASPAFTGSPTAPTPATADNSTSLATTAFVKIQGYLVGNQTITLSGDIAGSGATAITTTLPTINTSVGTFQGITINGKGQVTAATSMGYITGNQTITLSGDATGSGTTSIPVTLGTVNANVGTFQGITVNAKGLVTAAANQGYLTGNQTITLSGDISGSGTTAITATLPNVNTNVGTFQGITVNAKGLVTAATNMSYALSSAIPAPATATPLMDGTGAVGTSALYARQDHVHPSDTTRAPLASPALTGTPTSTTPTAGDNSTNIATTAFVTNAVAGVGGGPPGMALPGLTLSASAASGALTIALKDHTGADPSSSSVLSFWFNDPTGGPLLTQLNVNSALSIVLPSGSTLGTAANVAFRLWVVLFNDAGTARLGVVRCTISGSITTLSENEPVTSTAVSSSSTSAGVFYTGTAVSAKAYRILGFVEWSSSGIATAGTWTTTNLLRTRTHSQGARKPGDYVSRVYNFYTAGTTNSTSTYASSGAAQTIVQESACNLMKITASGYAVVAAAGTGTNSTGSGRILRSVGSVALSGGQNWSAASASGLNAQINTPYHQTQWDFPNNVGSITYTVQVASTGAAAAASINQVWLTVEEVMA